MEKIQINSISREEEKHDSKEKINKNNAESVNTSKNALNLPIDQQTLIQQ